MSEKAQLKRENREERALYKILIWIGNQILARYRHPYMGLSPRRLIALMYMTPGSIERLGIVPTMITSGDQGRRMIYLDNNCFT